MKTYFEERNIAVSIILSIVTCGLYFYYWLYVILSDVYALDGDDANPGIDILLMIVTCGIYMFFIWYKVAKALERIRTNKGMYSTDNTILFIVLAIFGLSIVNFAIAQSDLNQIVINENNTNNNNDKTNY